MQNKQKVIGELIQSKAGRIELGRQSFKFFCLYYLSESFKFPQLAPYHHQRIKDFEHGENLYVEGHRESAKSTILGVCNRIRKICYKKKKFMCNLCYDKRKAKAFNKIIVNILLSNNKIKDDFGLLFDKKGSRITEDDLMTEKGVDEFVTTNGIKIKAFGMGEAIRGEVFYTKDEGVVRPDDLFIDDIDNNDNTRNKNIIKDDMDFIHGEVFGGLQANSQIVWLGNVIRKDGRNPRIREEMKNAKGRKIHRNFVYGPPGKDSGEPIWCRFVRTNQEAEEKNKGIESEGKKYISLEQKKRDEKMNFSQNWLGIPISQDGGVIKDHWIRRYTPIMKPSEFDKIVMAIDPATKTKEQNDYTGIVVVGIKDGKYYVIYSKQVKLTPTNLEKFIIELNKVFKPNVIIKEDNIEIMLTERLKRAGLPVVGYVARKDKYSRLIDIAGLIELGDVLFRDEGDEEVIEQILNFPDVEHDDIMDALVYAIMGGSALSEQRVHIL